MSKPIGLMEVKQALRDQRFRDSLGGDFTDDLRKYLQNPGCACNVPLYRRILKERRDQLHEYYPGRELVDPEEEVRKLAENHWLVINCHVDDLEKALHDLPPGRKQLAVSRFEDQVTVVVNELDVLF